MTIYKVTTELRTNWWIKLLRFCRIKSKRKDFQIYLNYNGYEVGDMIHSDIGGKLKILDKEEVEGTFVNNLGYC